MLRPILDDILKNQTADKPNLVVFDLDSTLFDVSPRIEKILRDFAADPKNLEQFANELHWLQTAKPTGKDWGYTKSLSRVGAETLSPLLLDSLHDFWKTTFFSDPYLHFDVPLPGAQEFVQKIHASGAHIAYLTGRDVARMGKGSEEVLRRWNFPLGEKAILALKPEKGLLDTEFKLGWFQAVNYQNHSNVYFFENEPANIHFVEKALPQVKIVFLDSTHSGKEIPAPHWIAIEDFLIQES